MGKTRNRGDLPELSSLEREIMSVLWNLGECSSADVIEIYTRERPLAKTTIRTVLSNLRKKGYVEVVPSVDRGFRLKASVPRTTVAGRSLRDLVQTLFNGSPRHAISHLIKDEAIDQNDLDEIQQMIEARRSRKEKP
ncbi:MAG: BlaI/MecI/CopY family transcriptional regulator [Candidatus Hydrogenedentales bacterium]